LTAVLYVTENALQMLGKTRLGRYHLVSRRVTTNVPQQF